MTDNLDRHGRPLGGDRERDGRLLAAAQGIDLTAGVVDNATRAHWYERADVARAKLADWAEHPSDCLCRRGYLPGLVHPAGHLVVEHGEPAPGEPWPDCRHGRPQNDCTECTGLTPPTGGAR